MPSLIVRGDLSDPGDITTHDERDIHPIAPHSDPGHLGLRLALILVASFMLVLDFTIADIVLPSKERDFGVTTSVVQWVVTGDAIAFSGLLVLGGRGHGVRLDRPGQPRTVRW
jgi:hypothetical protein